jgi:hypothetical protein
MSYTPTEGRSVISYSVLAALLVQTAVYWVMKQCSSPCVAENGDGLSFLQNVGNSLKDYSVSYHRIHRRGVSFPLDTGSKMTDSVTTSAEQLWTSHQCIVGYPPRHVLRMWASENALNVDILQEKKTICRITSKSVSVILTAFLKPAPSSVFKCAKRFSAHLSPSLRKCSDHNRLCDRLLLNQNVSSSANSGHTTWSFETTDQCVNVDAHRVCRQSANTVGKLSANTVCWQCLQVCHKAFFFL